MGDPFAVLSINGDAGIAIVIVIGEIGQALWPAPHGVSIGAIIEMINVHAVIGFIGFPGHPWLIVAIKCEVGIVTSVRSAYARGLAPRATLARGGHDVVAIKAGVISVPDEPGLAIGADTKARIGRSGCGHAKELSLASPTGACVFTKKKHVLGIDVAVPDYPGLVAIRGIQGDGRGVVVVSIAGQLILTPPTATIDPNEDFSVCIARWIREVSHPSG